MSEERTRRWRDSLKRMTPEERTRAAATARAAADSAMATIDHVIGHEDFRAVMGKLLAHQDQLAQLVSEKFLNNFVTRYPRLPKFDVHLPDSFGLPKDLEKFCAPALEALERIYPENLRSLPGGKLEEVENLVHSGIPVFGAPRAGIVLELLAAADDEQRRSILSTRAADISSDCRDLLAKCETEWVQPMGEKAVEALDCFDEGREAAAQALAASILDTTLRKLLENDRTHYFRTNAEAPWEEDSWQELSIRQYLTLAPVWRAYRSFWAGRNEAVPSYFNRHASAHAVSREQYTPVNAIHALLLASTLLWFANREAERSEIALDQTPSAQGIVNTTR